MTDTISAKKRSQVMSQIRSRGTVIEKALYSVVRESLGSRWRIDRNVGGLPGNPDIVIRSMRLAIFADGCFYHGCPKHGHTPKSNRGYWAPKLARNCRRDQINRRKLRRLGFSVWTFWEHSLEGAEFEGTRRLLNKRLKRIRDRNAAEKDSATRLTTEKGRRRVRYGLHQTSIQ